MAEVAPKEEPAAVEEAPTGDTKPSERSGGGSKIRASVKRERPPKSFSETYCPKLAVYFPKFVCINNSRLALLYYVLIVWLVICIIGYFMVNDEYMVDATPWVRHFLYAKAPAASVMDSAPELTADLCTNPGNYKYKNSMYDYSPTGCAKRCGSGSAAGLCLYPEEMIEEEGSMVFVPTFIDQMIVIPSTETGGGCSTGYTASGMLCTKSDQVFVPGAGSVKIEFTHQYTSKPKQGAWLFATDDLRAQSMTKDGMGHDGKGMKTILIDTDGEIKKTYESGDVIDPTIDELLEVAEYDDVGPSGDLVLDQEYTRDAFELPESVHDGADMSAKRTASLRLTGVTVTIDLYVTDKGKCYHGLTDSDVVFEDQGNVACMFVFAERMWTSSGKSEPVHTSAGMGYMTRKSSGVRVKFRNGGAFTIFDLTELLKIFTVAVVWIQIPLQVVYYFTIWFLGHLSSVYSRVIHQDLHLAEACKGLASRLVSHSAAYMDLQDASTGISKNRLLDRFRTVLESNKDLDEQEIVKFVDFVFEGMQSLSQASSSDESSDTVNIQEYCTACSTNEPLDFDSLVKLFDKDRKIGILEGCFLDESIRAVIRSARQDTHEEIAAAQRDQEEAQANMVETLYMLQDLKIKTDDLETTAKVSSSANLESLKNEPELTSKAGVIAASRKAAGKNVIDPVSDFAITEDPKPDQRESNGSIADEDSPGRNSGGDYGER